MEVKEFYKGKNIFITGATGFVGIALVEKLLRCVPDVGTIYLLVRPKRGKTVEERLKEFCNNPVFERLKDERGDDVMMKLQAVSGDIGDEGLGLSEADRQELTNKVDVVFHSAASLDFEASFKVAANINLLGTRRVVELCKKMTQLKVLLHVSSAYVNSNLKSAEEKLYPPPGDVDKVLEMAENLSDEALSEILPVLLGTHPNSYTFTKALAEHEVANSISSFPSCIVRPSMIVAAWKEPVPGWTISKNGPQGFIMGAAKGVVRRLPMDPDVICDYIPVDVVVNGIMVGACSAATHRNNETSVYHLTSSTYKPFRWRNVESKLESTMRLYPLKSAVWYPYMKLIPSIFWFRVSAFIFHMIPAYILDTLTKVTGGRPILVKLHTNINKSLNLLEPFIFTEWMFDNKKTLELHKTLAEKDQEAFGLDIGDIDWIEFFSNLVQGVRRYLNNEKPSTLEAARKRDKILWVLNLLVQLGFVSTIWLLLSRLPIISSLSAYITLPLLAAFFSLL